MKTKKEDIEDRGISDGFLVKYLKSKRIEIAFIGNGPAKSSERIEKLSAQTSLLKQWDLVRGLWESLLGDALVFLKSRDEREEYHDRFVYGVEDLSSFFETFREYETVLYGTRGRYRDHLVHVFRVFLLGECLIRETFGFGQVTCWESGGLTISQEEKEAMWCIISLCHDLGYPLEAIFDINKRARDMFLKFGRVSISELAYGLSPQYQTISDFILRFVSSKLVPPIEKSDQVSKERVFHVHLQTKFFLKFANALDKFNHGLISCIVLMKYLVYFLESDYLMDNVKPLKPDDARHFLIRQNMLRAIASHACDEIYHLEATNFPFLLLIIDEMQEWGRPRLTEVFKKEIPNSRLTVDRMNPTEIAYTIRFTGASDTQDSHDEIESFFHGKCRRFTEVLRGAADGKLRKIELGFKVIDGIDTKNERSYVLKHEKPDKAEIFINGKKVDIYKYLLESPKKSNT